jgi:hypothetical protein
MCYLWRHPFEAITLFRKCREGAAHGDIITNDTHLIGTVFHMYIIFLCNRWCLCTLSLVLLRRDGRLDFYLLDLLRRNWSMRLCFCCILIINLYGRFLLFMRTSPILCCTYLYVLLRVSWLRYKAFYQILISFIVLQSRVEAQCDFIIKWMYLTF